MTMLSNARHHYLLNLLALAIGVVMLVPSVAYADTNGGIGARPAHSDPDNPRTESIFIYSLEKGQKKTDQVLVINNSETKQTISLFPVDGVVTNTGAFSCEQNVESRDAVGSWISLSQSSVTLGAGEQKAVDFTVAIPQTADVGEQNGCIALQSSSTTPTTKGNVIIRMRQAIRMVVVVPGELRRDITLDSFDIAHSRGHQAYSFRIKNTGNVSSDTDIQLTVKNMFGKEIYKNGGSYPVLPGKSLDMKYESTLSSFFGGWYTIEAGIAYDKRAEKYGLTDSSQLTYIHSPTRRILVAPHPGAVLGLAVIVGICIYVILRRKRRMHFSSSRSFQRR